ncbi:DUF3276 family protein [Niabella drilacis]|uniref:DNA-binding protein n=1 Tax=Niabella drilacis (strain DSM 25811 / CCM 8410 / CCUG 62505 / LMG 26954 / E90) TaxID=1285928 RepID=A0A1G6WFS9_NIADE|nr:DUF3276 family protein [Niabella drilacis]SDD64658.1 Protein of unknown function [Niabella drilacis]
MENEHNDRKLESIYSKRLRAGKRRTYFFDVRSTKGNDYYLTITESRKRFDDNGYDRHKVFLYKEDFNKFLKALNEAIDYVKTDLMPDFNFDAFNHEDYDDEGGPVAYQPAPVTAPAETPAPPEEDADPTPVITEAPAPAEEINTPAPQNDAPASGSHEEVEKW